MLSLAHLPPIGYLVFLCSFLHSEGLSNINLSVNSFRIRNDKKETIKGFIFRNPGTCRSTCVSNVSGSHGSHMERGGEQYHKEVLLPVSGTMMTSCFCASCNESYYFSAPSKCLVLSIYSPILILIINCHTSFTSDT